jgi:uncharacterized glyoxalase superfamily protein PhnB
VLTPYLVVNDTKAAIEFYRAAFGATEVARMMEPGGKRVMHAEIRIGDSHLMLSDAFPEMGSRSPHDLNGSPVSIHLFTEDADGLMARAVKAGATVTMPVGEMFWGDRFGRLTYPFGHHWSLATHVKDLTPAEIERGAVEAFKAHAEAQKKARK